MTDAKFNWIYKLLLLLYVYLYMLQSRHPLTAEQNPNPEKSSYQEETSSNTKLIWRPGSVFGARGGL